MFYPALTPVEFQESQHPIVRVDAIAKVSRNKVLPTELSGKQVFHYSIPNVQDIGTGKIEDGDTIDSDKWLITEEAVLISKLNPRKSTICLATPQENVTVTSTEFVVLSAGNSIDNRYLKYVLESEIVRQFLSSRTTSATRSHQRVNPHDITALGIPWPEASNRAKTVKKLDSELAEIDEFITECAQLSTLTDEHRLAAINSLIEPLLDNTTPIKYLGTLKSGLTLGATYNEPLESYPYLRVANVQAGMVDLREIKEVAVPPSVAIENMLQKNDVLMTEGGDRDKLGRGAIWSGKVSPMLHQNHVFAFRCTKEKLLPEFLIYCLEASYARHYFENNARQSTNLASTNSTIVKNFRVPSICIDKQTKIVEFLKNQVRTVESIHMSSNKIAKIFIERKNSSTHEAITIPKSR